MMDIITERKVVSQETNEEEKGRKSNSQSQDRPNP